MHMDVRVRYMFVACVRVNSSSEEPLEKIDSPKERKKKTKAKKKKKKKVVILDESGVDDDEVPWPMAPTSSSSRFFALMCARVCAARSGTGTGVHVCVGPYKWTNFCARMCKRTT